MMSSSVDFTRCFAPSRLALASWYFASRLPPSKSDQESVSPSVQFSLSWGWLPPSWLPPYEPVPLMSGKKFRKVWRSVASAALTRSLTWRYSGRCLMASVRSRPRSRLTGSKTRLSWTRSEEHTSELQSRLHLVCRLLLEKKKKQED